MARLRRLLPAWEVCSPRIEEPGLRVRGARPGVGGELGPGGEGLARGLGQEHCGGRDPRCRARVVRGRAREGGPPARAQARPAISALWACKAMSRRARWGRTAPAASVPATVTVCLVRASIIACAHRAWRLAPWALSLGVSGFSRTVGTRCSGGGIGWDYVESEVLG